MPRRPTYLLVQDGRCYFRRPVPSRLRPILGKREIKYALDTSDAATAKKRLPRFCIRAQHELDEAEAKWRAQTSQAALRKVELSDDELFNLASRWFVRALQRDAVIATSDLDAQTLREDVSYAEEWEAAEPSTRQATEKLLESVGLDLEPSGPSFRHLQNMIHGASVERQRRLLARAMGVRDTPRDERFDSLNPASAPTASMPLTLAELMDRFSREDGQLKLKEKTALKRKAQYKMFREYFGAQSSLGTLTRERVRQFRDDLQCLCPNVSKPPHERKTLPELIAISKATDGPRIKPETINSHLGALHRLLAFAVKEQWLPSNPASGLYVHDPVRAEDKRHPFSSEHLKAIFNAPLYVGCKNDERGYDKPGPERPRRGRFWVPLIALYSGLRLNEICQLTEDDIQTVAGFNVIRCTDLDGKKLKTRSARRKVPIHKELETLGFLDFVRDAREMRPPRSRLFPDIGIASTGYASDNFSKWFARFLDKRGITERGLEFHSFRHSFKDRLDAAAIDLPRKQQILGWAREGVEPSYGGADEARLPGLAEAVGRVRYPSLDLSHLRP